MLIIVVNSIYVIGANRARAQTFQGLSDLR
jgi:hypothetical protein